ncbi:MAG: hypothetical protein ACAI25_14875 [Planctomycetota bacterium]
MATRALAAAALFSLSLAGCIGSEPAREKPAPKPRINQVQLQDQLQRFAGVFNDRVLQAAEPLISFEAPKQTRRLGMRQLLVYYTTALDIATGRFPEANLLDMLAFLMLSNSTLDEFWIPEVYGEAGRPLAKAFTQSTEDLERLAGRLLTETQLAEIRKLVQAWRSENPGQRRVEQVRLFSFAATTGRLANEREKAASGLLSSLTAATQSADQAVLLGERALFLSHRMPFVLRMHARLATQEVADEVVATLGQTEASLLQANELAARTVQAIGGARSLVDVLRPLLEAGDSREPLRIERLLARTRDVVDDSHRLVGELDGIERSLSSAERVTDRSSILMKEMRGFLPAEEHEPLVAVIRIGVLYAALLGVILVTLFWGGYVLAHRLSR